MFDWVSISMWNASSSSISRATRLRWSRLRMLVAIRSNIPNSSGIRRSGNLKHFPDRKGELLPVGRFGVEPATSGRREPVNARLPVVLGCRHFRRQHSCGFEPVKSRVQGALTHAEGLSRYLTNALLDAPPVIWAESEGLQNQQIERALEVFSLGHP